MVSPGSDVLIMGENYPPCSKMKERSMGFFGFGSQILPKATSQRRKIVTYTHCGGDRLKKRKAQPSTALMSAMYLDCLNESAVALVCENWGHLK